MTKTETLSDNIVKTGRGLHDAIRLISHPTVQGIIRCLPIGSQKELMVEMGMGQAKLAGYLQEMRKFELTQESSNGKMTAYSLSEGFERLEAFVFRSKLWKTEETMYEDVKAVLNAIFKSHGRLEILKFLEENPGCEVNQIYTELRMEQAIASQHLSVLRQYGVFDFSKDGPNKRFKNYWTTNKLYEVLEAVERY